MRILHVISSLTSISGGPAKACRELAQAQASAGHEVMIQTVALGPRPADSLMEKGAWLEKGNPTIWHHPGVWPYRWTRSTKLRRALGPAIAWADIVHIHGCYLYPCLLAGKLARRQKKPYLVRPLGVYTRYIQQRRRWRKVLVELLFNRRYIKGAAALHFTSQAESAAAKDYVGEKRGFLVPLGVTLNDPYDSALPVDLTKRFPQLIEKQVLLFLGRLHPVKRIDLLIDAFAVLAAVNPLAHLLLVGPDDGERAAAEKRLAERGLTERATFTGLLEGVEKTAAFKLARLFMMPSQTESFGLAAIEAAAAGVPLLLSDQVAIASELVEAGAAVACPVAVQPLSRSLLALFDDEGRLQKMAAAGPIAAARFSWPLAAKNLDAVYRTLLAEAGQK